MQLNSPVRFLGAAALLLCFSPFHGGSAALMAASLTISPAVATVSLGGSQQFTASGAGAASLKWMVNDIPGGNAAVGVIDASGARRIRWRPPLRQLLSYEASQCGLRSSLPR